MELNSIDNPDNKLNALITKSLNTAFNYFVTTQFLVSIKKK
jgi:hypothetical protein